MTSTDVKISDSLGIDTLETKSMVSAEYCEYPEVELVSVNGRKFFKADRAANIRMRSSVSKIWEYGTEHRLENDIS
jgi:hypothetical protein